MNLKKKIMFMNGKTKYMKKLLIIPFTILFCGAKAQDTIPARKIPVVTQQLNPKNGNVLREWYGNKRVKCGYIVRLDSTTYVVDKKQMTLMTKTKNYEY